MFMSCIFFVFILYVFLSVKFDSKIWKLSFKSLFSKCFIISLFIFCKFFLLVLKFYDVVF